MIDKVDFGLLAALEENGRQSFAALAESSGLSKTPCWTRVQAMEQAGIIRGYRADIDPAALGLSVFAHIQVAIDPARRDQFESAVMDDRAILECHSIAGDADYMLEVVCRDVEALDDLLRHHLTLLPGVTRSHTTISLKVIKPRAPLSGAIGGGSGPSPVRRGKTR